MTFTETSTSSCMEAARKLDSFLVQLPTGNNDETWKSIEAIAQSLANGLRDRHSPEDNHTNLGKGALPQTLTSLLKAALRGSQIPDDHRTGVVSEILRVAANLCMDHDDNRGHLLEAGLPKAIVLLLEGYAELIPSGPSEAPLSLSIPHLKVVRNAIGVLLNSSVGYAPVRTRLTSLEAIVTMLKLSISIYPPGSWMNAALLESSREPDLESWTLRSGLSNWAWRAISELKDNSTPQIFNASILPLLIPSLRAFTPPYRTPSPDSLFVEESPLRASLLQADFDCLEESCMFLESLALDVEDFRLSLARGLHFPAEHDGVPCLSSMLTFVEKGDYPPLWYETDLPDVKGHEKAFDICKGAMIKAIVEVSGEEKNEEVIWDEEEADKPGGEFVCTMVEWLRGYVTERDEAGSTESRRPGRDDIVICATLSLGNLARREQHSSTLLSPPHSIAPLLSSSHLLGPTSDIRLKHGVISLLKHLAQSSMQSPSNIAALTRAEIVKRLATSNIWQENTDPMRELVQVAAIGVVKHLCNASVENTFALTLHAPAEQSGLQQILRLGLISDSVRVKSEGTRVLVNVIKSLWAGQSPSPAAMPNINGKQPSDTSQEKQRLRTEAMRAVLTVPCVEALARLIGRSRRYPILINEGTVALSLLSMQREGAELVVNALNAPLPPEAAANAAPISAGGTASTSSHPTSPVSPPNRPPAYALEMLIVVLKNVHSQMAGGHAASAADFPPEIAVNVCALLGQLGKGTTNVSVKDATRPLLEQLASLSTAQGKEGMVNSAAKRALEAWAA